jgi:hypothetical protein
MRILTVIILLPVLLFSACSISSPLTHVDSWLNLHQTGDVSAFCNLILEKEPGGIRPLQESEVSNCVQKALAEKPERYEVVRATALTESQLQTLGITEGYQVDYVLEVNGQSQNRSVYAVKYDNQWRVVLR